MATIEKASACVGYYLSGGIPIGWTTILGLTSTNVAGSTKKVIVACIGTIAYTAKDAPRYLLAQTAIVIVYLLITVDLWIIRVLAVKENKKRDHRKAELSEAYVVEKNHEFQDLTDRQNLEFRYSL
ncbi:hypothetical protein B0O99DRAFT_600616 [Bisporella sp. PMI_857]|nr:hypothetical protein B0O99DRAFT_600616 [Bisporella sp. PMI_857]